MIMQIIQGKFAATIRKNGDTFLVIVTRNGDCLHGIPSRSYADMRRAETGARKMIAKAAA